MKHFLFNLTKNTAKEAQITGGGASRVGNNSDLSPKSPTMIQKRTRLGEKDQVKVSKFQSFTAKIQQNWSEKAQEGYEGNTRMDRVLSRIDSLQSRSAQVNTSFRSRYLRYAAMIFCVLAMSVANIGMAWGTQTSLISGVTLPDIPSSVLNMETQEDFTPASNWIVFNPNLDAGSKSWMSKNSGNTGSASPSAPSGCVAPFVNLSSKACYKVRQTERTYAIRFSKATDISFMVCSGGSRSVLVSLYEYDGSSKQDSITTKSESNNTVTELYFDELDLTKEYIAYIYENSSSDGWLYEIAVKRAGPGPYSVTYDKNGGTGTMSDASSPYVKNTTVTTLANTFTAPTGKTFTGWNTRADGTGTSYAAGATFTAVKDVKLYAQWAYPATGTGTITYTLTKASDAVSGAVTGVSTISGLASAFTKSNLTIGTTSQAGYCGNIGDIPAEESSTYYVDLPFTVASGYTFNPTDVSVKVNPLSGTSYMKVKVSILDNSLTVTSSELSCAKSTDNLVPFASGAFTDKLFTGTVHIRVYLYCATSGKYAYIKSPVTISGTVAAEAPSSDCSAYEFHYGTHGEDDWETACFEQVGETNEWKIEDFTIPGTTHFYVGYHGDGTNGWNSTWSSERAWTDWPTKSDSKWQGQIFLAPNDGALGSFAVGQATGAVGTLTIHSDYNDLNKFLSFTPNGYGITYGGTGHAFAETATANMYETDVVTLPDVSTTYNIGLATATEGTYVKSIHSKATDEAISAMSVTEIDGGKKKIYLYSTADSWIGSNAKMAIYDFTDSRNCWGDNTDANKFMTKLNDNLWVGYVQGDATDIILVRVNPDNTDPGWDWGQSHDITLSALNNYFTITGTWSDSKAEYTATSMHPATGQKGKFRMWANSADQNWYVHFIPYYVLSYDANGGSGTTAATERNSESSTLTVSVAANDFTAPTGKHFDHWDTEEGDGGTDYAEGADYTLTADATLYAQWAWNTYDVTPSLTNVSVKTGTTGTGAATHGSAYTVTLQGATGYNLPATVTVTIGGSPATLTTDYTWNSSTGVLTVLAAKVTGDISITASGAAQVYDITYEDQGGADFSGVHADGYPTTHTYGSSTTLKTASKAGYTFGGWYTNSACTDDAVTSLGATDYTAGITLYAKWTIKTYTVTFASNNDDYGTVSPTSIASVPHGSEVNIDDNVLTLKETDVTASPTTSTAAYTYAFSGWSVSDGDAITSAQTITATFTRTANSYSVTHTLTNVTTSSAETATFGTNYTATFSASSGYALPSSITVTIGGDEATEDTEYTWNKSTGTVTIGGSYILDNIVIEIEAEAAVTTYSVTYAAGVTLTSGSVPTDATAYDGDGTESVTVAGNTGSMVYTGYTFRGWTYNSTFYEAGNTFTMPASNVTLTAVWDEITSVNYYYGIIHITAGALTKGTTDTQTFFTNTSGTIATSSAVSISSAPSSTDYYYESNDLSGTELAKSSNWNTSSTSNRYMRALKFKSGDTYTLALGSNVATSITFYGKCGSASKTLTIGGQEWTSSSTKNTHESHAFTKSGDFTGNVSMVCGGDFYGIIIITCAGSSNYTVSFSDGETAPASHSDWPSNIVGVPSGVKILEPTTDPSATGYNFGGWYTNAKCTTEVDWSSNITADKIVYAKWTAKTTSITLDANTSNHGSGANKSASVSYDATALTSITHTTPATGYALDGYYTTATDDPTTGVKIINADGSLVKNTTYTTNDDTPKWKSELSALTLYARYVTAYQVTYNGNGKTGGGAAPSDATYYAPGAEVTVAGNTNSMTKTNCVFMGWNTAADGTGTTYMGGEKMTMPSENTTLYALWGVSLTWNVQVNVAETTVTTTSTASSYTTHVANPGDLALNDLTVTSDKKSDATNKISTTKDKGGYVSATFAVATGYQFTPTHMILKTTATTEAKTVEVNVGSESQTWNQSASSSASPSSHTYKFEDASAITGTGTMKIYVYGGKDGTKGYRLGTPITVYGKVEPCTYTITYKDKGNVDFSGVHTDSPSAHPTSHTYGSATTLNSATKTGYTFGGWYTSSDCSTGLVTSLGATAYTANITLYAKWTPVTLTFLGNGSGVKWDWKDATNWSPACVPTIDHDVIIQKPVEVSMYGAGNIAKAKSIVIDKYGDNTGRLVIKGPYGLVVKETIQMKNEDGDLVAPESADLRIESTSYFENGALAIKGFTEASEKDINATVIYYTTSRVFGFSVEGEYIGFYVNQFIGTPLRTSSLYDYYGCWIYKWDPTADDGKGDWVYQSTAMTPFQGYDILNEYPSSPSFWLTGPLVYSEDQEFDLTYTGSGGKNGSENMFANSWMAPIDVTKFKTTDFAGGDDSKMEATIYVFNSGTPNNWRDKTEDLGTDPGQYLCMAVNSGTYTGGISEIQSMQAFSVYAKADGAKLTLDYDSLVYEPMLKRSTAINPMRAPRRAKAESEMDDPEVMRIRVAGDQSADKIHLLIRDDFSEGFDNGWDASKMFGESFAPQLYAITSTGKELTVNCTPDAEGTVVGFQKGDRDSVYTFSFEYDGMSVFYLNDLKEQTSTLISNESTYEFIAENGDAETRFIISATPIQQVPTGIEDVQGDNVQSAKVRKLILNDKLYIIRGGRMYDATGRKVK